MTIQIAPNEQLIHINKIDVLRRLKREGIIERKNVTGKFILNVEVSDFGPISGGKIALKPLTLLIGPNNAGKSYASMLVITTHSDYLLEQLSSFIFLSKVTPQNRVKKYKYSKDDFISYDEIAAYVFRRDRKMGGHKIIEVEITEEDGISQEEFIKIHESLYEESIKLRRNLKPMT